MPLCIVGFVGALLATDGVVENNCVLYFTSCVWLVKNNPAKNVVLMAIHGRSMRISGVDGCMLHFTPHSNSQSAPGFHQGTPWNCPVVLHLGFCSTHFFLSDWYKFCLVHYTIHVTGSQAYAFQRHVFIFFQNWSKVKAIIWICLKKLDMAIDKLCHRNCRKSTLGVQEGLGGGKGTFWQIKWNGIVRDVGVYTSHMVVIECTIIGVFLAIT